jgi:hypothetical protein
MWNVKVEVISVMLIATKAYQDHAKDGHCGNSTRLVEDDVPLISNVSSKKRILVCD